MSDDNHRTIAVDVLKGALAGAAATWVMQQLTSWLYEREEAGARQREDHARGGKTAFERAAEEGARRADVQLSDATRRRLGTAIHWATGITAGALYAVTRRRTKGVAAADGLPFGTLFFLTVDELMNPLFGFTPGPRMFPWQAHARGFAGHLAFGATTEFMLKGLDRVV
jgi:hypothetical protein